MSDWGQTGTDVVEKTGKAFVLSRDEHQTDTVVGFLPSTAVSGCICLCNDSAMSKVEPFLYCFDPLLYGRLMWEGFGQTTLNIYTGMLKISFKIMPHYFGQAHFQGISSDEFFPSSQWCGQTCFSHYMMATALKLSFCDSFSLNSAMLMWDGRGIGPFSMSHNTNRETQPRWLIHTLTLSLLFLHNSLLSLCCYCWIPFVRL